MQPIWEEPPSFGGAQAEIPSQSDRHRVWRLHPVNDLAADPARAIE
jgi:hypothetical protein